MSQTLDERARDASRALRAAADLRHQAAAETEESDARRRPHLTASAKAAVAVLVAAAVIAVSVVAVSRRGHGGQGGVSIEALATTLTQSARLTITGAFTVPQPGASSTYVSTGTFDFGHQSGRLSSRSTSGSASVSGLVVWVNGHEFDQIDATTAATLPSRARRGKSWIEANTLSSSTAPSTNPYTVLKQVRLHASVFRDIGAGRVDGQAVRHYRAVVTGSLDGRPLPRGIVPAVHDVDLYVDTQGRVVRLTITTNSAGGDLTTSQRIDFSDYGVNVVVDAPPADQVISAVEADPPAPHLTGSWSLAASGNAHGFDWKLFRAPADYERVCWSFASKATQNSPAFPSGPGFPAPLRHNGDPVVCSRTGVWASPLQYLANYLNVPGPGIPAEVLVAVVDSDVTSIADTSIDPHFNGFVDTSPVVTYNLTLRDGSALRCKTTNIQPGFSSGAETCDVAVR